MKDISTDTSFERFMDVKIAKEMEPSKIHYADNSSEIDKHNSKQKATTSYPSVSFFSLFRFANTTDKFFIVIGIISAAIGGICTPLMVVQFGDISQVLIDDANTDTSIPQTIRDILLMDGSEENLFMDTMGRLCMNIAILGLILFITVHIFVTLFNLVSENMIHRLRQRYLKALLRQNIGWFDMVEDKSFVSRIAEDAMKVQDATGDKLGLCIYYMTLSLFSLCTAFYNGWKLTLVVLSSGPAFFIVGGVMTLIQSKLAQDEQSSYAKAGKVAEEVIGNIRTVLAFSGQAKEVKRFHDVLKIAKVAGKTRGTISGIAIGLINLIIYATYALGFWYGTKLVVDEPETYKYSNMMIVFVCVVQGVFIVGQCASYFEVFSIGRGSAAAMYNVIDRNPEIDIYSTTGKFPQIKATGKIEFRDVSFHYPSRPEVQILDGLTFTVNPGQTVAFVGKSGCGKSTCLQLLQRFYDPVQGKIFIDDNNIEDLNLQWLRSKIGVVSQEPVLFNTTIYDNISYGREFSAKQEIEVAARQANAHSFISKLPKSYDTIVGDRGTQLSGGQKQRIAIARAIVGKCSILILDEATSALDTQSEAIVQAALDRARVGRTTLIVAHRLSTIRNADFVVVINEGKVEEVGTHSELLRKKGMYYELVTTQMVEYDSAHDPDFPEMDTTKELEFLEGCILNDEDESAAIYSLSTEENIEKSKLAKEASIGRMLKLNQNEWPYILVGVISAIVQGAMLPLYSILYGNFLGSLSEPDPQPEANKFALIFLGIGVVAGTAQFLQSFAFTISGEALTMRIREMCFSAILRQEPGWFDDPSRSVGGLCSRLSEDAANVNGVTGSRIGIIFQAISTISFSIGISIYYSPKLGAVALIFAPFILFATYFGGKIMMSQNIGEMDAMEGAAKIAVEAVSNIRTVASLGREDAVVNEYMAKLQKTHQGSKKASFIRGIIIALAQASPLLAYASVLYYGSYLIKNEGETYDNVFKVSQALIFGSMMIGQALSYAPNYYKAKISSTKIERLLDSRPLIENSKGVGLQIWNAKGNVEFKDIVFSYPTRPHTKVLNNLNLKVSTGKHIALVGHSGCGKSSCINLILRFYDPTSGSINLDDIDISRLNVEALRSVMGIVSQEPALFDLSLRENIAYGDNSREVDMTEIIAAAKLANIHNVICSLPAQYETRVGEMGSQLSAGQKQRVAIARALVKEINGPKILLLDEATSALDMESEKVVQDAVDEASHGRTTITIAHRLASIQNANQIVVIDNKRIAEYGTHSELLRKKGIYYRLWNVQASN